VAVIFLTSFPLMQVIVLFFNVGVGMGVAFSFAGVAVEATVATYRNADSTSSTFAPGKP